MIYEIWTSCTEECLEKRPPRRLMVLEDKDEAYLFVKSLRDPFHEAEVREVEV